MQLLFKNSSTCRLVKQAGLYKVLDWYEKDTKNECASHDKRIQLTNHNRLDNYHEIKSRCVVYISINIETKWNVYP